MVCVTDYSPASIRVMSRNSADGTVRREQRGLQRNRNLLMLPRLKPIQLLLLLLLSQLLNTVEPRFTNLNVTVSGKDTTKPRIKRNHDMSR